MKAIILAAGRGSRLLPLTNDLPKCLLPVGNTTVLGLQLDTLYAAGIERVSVVTGFNSAKVEAEIAARTKGPEVEISFNPFYQVADNLASCWMVRESMDEDFLLINGDTLFSPVLLGKVLAADADPVSVTIDRKDYYDGDDMKVTLSDEMKLLAIGKTLQAHETQGESIGMLRFTGEGVTIFRDMLESVMRTPKGTTSWFLKAIDGLAKSGTTVGTIPIVGEVWAELDTPEDYDIVLELFGTGDAARGRFAVV